MTDFQPSSAILSDRFVSVFRRILWFFVRSLYGSFPLLWQDFRSIYPGAFPALRVAFSDFWTKNGGFCPVFDTFRQLSGDSLCVLIRIFARLYDVFEWFCPRLSGHL